VPAALRIADSIDRTSDALEALSRTGDLADELIDRQALLEHILALQKQRDWMAEEINLLRRRDDTLNTYMARLDEELRLAGRIQQDFLPRILPQVGRARFHTLFRPAGYVSGDLFDVVRLDSHHVGFWIADAVGHGMPAALLTMFIKHGMITREVTNTGYTLLTPGETLGRLNAALVEQNLTQATFATAIYGIVDTQTLDVQIARAGHPSPLRITAEGVLEDIPGSGGLLGIFPDEVFETTRITLEPGQRLLFYSDGVELTFGSGDASETTHWRTELQSRTHLPSEDLMADLVGYLDNQQGSLAPKDDLTLILLDPAGYAEPGGRSK
jgi:serine phosphatase RsbU (regulator of sigma subunit)